MANLDPDSIALERRGAGPPLVLLHCLGVDHHFWDFAGELARDFTLISYDLPGHGQSPVPSGAYTIEDLSAQLGELLARHNIARAHIAGISLWAQRAAAARSAGVKALVDGLLNIWFTPQSVTDNTEAVRYVRAALEKSSGEGYALACEALAAADLRAAAAKIAAPTLVICGDDDIPSFLDAARWLESNIKDARLAWLAKARHASVIERPSEAIALMRKFLLG
jgi:3-oxoadipate enol-lactonase